MARSNFLREVVSRCTYFVGQRQIIRVPEDARRESCVLPKERRFCRKIELKCHDLRSEEVGQKIYNNGGPIWRPYVFLMQGAKLSFSGSYTRVFAQRGDMARLRVANNNYY